MIIYYYYFLGGQLKIHAMVVVNHDVCSDALMFRTNCDTPTATVIFNHGIKSAMDKLCQMKNEITGEDTCAFHY